MNLSHIARQLVAVALAAGGTTVLLGADAATAGTSSCANVTGFLDDHGRTVTAVFHVSVTCEEVSVLTWYASGPDGEDPQDLLERVSQDNVAPGDYQWTVAAPPRRCFRQLDLRVPGRNVDSFVGGRELCSSSAPPTTAPTTAPTTSTTSTTAPAAVLPVVTTPLVPTAPTPSTTGPVAVLPAVISRPAAAELPNTGDRLGDEVTIALLGIALGTGTLAARRWHHKRYLETAPPA